MTSRYMKSAILLVSLLIITSCSDSNPVQQYGSGVKDAYKSARKLDTKVNVLEVRKSIQEFYAANGRYPADLNELAGFNGITLKGDKYEYDPSSGNSDGETMRHEKSTTAGIVTSKKYELTRSDQR